MRKRRRGRGEPPRFARTRGLPMQAPMKTSLRRYYPDQVQGLKPMASSQPAQSPAPLVRFWQVLPRAADPPGRRTLRQHYPAYPFRQDLSSGKPGIFPAILVKRDFPLDKFRRMIYNL